MSSSVWFLDLNLSAGGLTVKARGVDLVRDRGMGVVGMLTERSLRSSIIVADQHELRRGALWV